MARKVHYKPAEIQRIRGEWYSYHFNLRQMANALDAEELTRYRAAVDMLPRYELHWLGGSWLGGGDDVYPLELHTVCARFSLNWELVNAWYLSEWGWAEFQRLWKELPEPMELSTARVGTSVQVVPIVHNSTVSV